MCDSGKDETMVHGYCIAPKGLEHRPLFVKNLDTLKEMLDMELQDDGDEYTAWAKTMKQYEVDALPEYDGW